MTGIYGWLDTEMYVRWSHPKHCLIGAWIRRKNYLELLPVRVVGPSRSSRGHPEFSKMLTGRACAEGLPWRTLRASGHNFSLGATQGPPTRRKWEQEVAGMPRILSYLPLIPPRTRTSSIWIAETRQGRFSNYDTQFWTYLQNFQPILILNTA